MRTGMLDVGQVFEGALASAQQHGLRHEILTGAEVNRRFPGADEVVIGLAEGGCCTPVMAQDSVLRVTGSSTGAAALPSVLDG